MPDDDKVTISQQEYDRLLDRDFKLSCLENGGVDSWEWYSESLEEYFKAHDEDL